MNTQILDGGAEIENLVGELNAREVLLRWTGTEGDDRWVRISGHPHFSPAGTEIAQQRLGTDDAFVLDVGNEHLYVAVREDPKEPETDVTRGRFGEWWLDMPLQHYERWRSRFGSLHHEDGRAFAHPSDYKIGFGSVTGSRAEFSRWVRNFPLRSYRRVPSARWWFRRVMSFYVWPDFAEPMDSTDIELLIGDYPATASRELDVVHRTGHVFFRDPKEALSYPEKLQKAMADRGVECSPRVGMIDVTDPPGSPECWRWASPSSREVGIPRPDDAEAEHMLQILHSLDGCLLMQDRLRRRLEDGSLSGRRRTDLDIRLEGQTGLARNAEEALERWTRAELYGLLIRLRDERDDLADRNRLLGLRAAEHPSGV